MPAFPDHFSGVAASYAAHRPRYPEALFDALMRMSPATDVAWDCGCGTGQASLSLAARFDRVWATDASAQQITQAVPHPRVTYRTATAEASGLPDASVSLVTVAQALHWFDVDAFHAEVRRVLVPGGVIAEWCYTLLDVPSAPAVASLVNGLDATMRAWWPPERRHVDERYASLGFPFAPPAVGAIDADAFDADAFAMDADWTIEQLMGYLGTWSAITRCRQHTGADPLVVFARELRAVWGAVERHRMRWPLVLRVGRQPSGTTSRNSIVPPRR